MSRGALASRPDTALNPLNDDWKFFLAHLPFTAQPQDIREHFSVSLISATAINFRIIEFFIFHFRLPPPTLPSISRNSEPSISSSLFSIN